jgi:DNA-binding transcriptional regulator LsrR (DeoR family)
MLNSNDTRALVAKVARLYYLEDRSQQEIANKLGLSRQKGVRLLSRVGVA